MWWIDAKKKPPTEKKVLAGYVNGAGKSRVVTAFYVPRFTVESSPDDEVYDEYNEKTDTYYLKEGWYESFDNWADWTSVFISEGEVTHWMHLPNLPVGKPNLSVFAEGLDASTFDGSIPIISEMDSEKENEKESTFIGLSFRGRSIYHGEE